MAYGHYVQCCPFVEPSCIGQWTTGTEPCCPEFFLNYFSSLLVIITLLFNPLRESEIFRDCLIADQRFRPAQKPFLYQSWVNLVFIKLLKGLTFADTPLNNACKPSLYFCLSSAVPGPDMIFFGHFCRGISV